MSCSKQKNRNKSNQYLKAQGYKVFQWPVEAGKLKKKFKQVLRGPLCVFCVSSCPLTLTPWRSEHAGFCGSTSCIAWLLRLTEWMCGWLQRKAPKWLQQNIVSFDSMHCSSLSPTWSLSRIYTGRWCSVITPSGTISTAVDLFYHTGFTSHNCSNTLLGQQQHWPMQCVAKWL